MIKTIYKKDSKGKIRSLKVESTEEGYLIQTSGLLDGKKTEHKKLVKQKNIGKANETSLSLQAHMEFGALVRKKLRKGYFETELLAQTTEVILPMLAKKIQEVVIQFPCYIQPKLDGMRCIIKEKTPFSRENIEITTVDHIMKNLPELNGTIIDGELYAHGLSFQANMKLLKKVRPDTSKLIKYWVYDLMSPKPFEERYADLCALVQDSATLVVVPSYACKDMDEVQSYHDQFIELGYEGSIVRHSDEGYVKTKRSSQLLKKKDFIDIALEIVDITPADADPTQGVPWVDYEGIITKCGCKLSHEDRRDLLTNKNKYIGKTAEIRYFELTDKGGLRFPQFHGIRLDK